MSRYATTSRVCLVDRLGRAVMPTAEVMAMETRVEKCMVVGFGLGGWFGKQGWF
jgi:hypothetical protein